MAKKVSPIVIPAVVDTSGVDKGVSDIQSKLKKVGGSAGGFGGGGTQSGFGGGGSAAANAASNGGAAMAAALGATVGAKGFAAGRANVWEGMNPRKAGRYRAFGMTRTTANAFEDMMSANREFRQNYASAGSSAWEYLDNAQRGQTRYYGVLANQNRKRLAVERGMQKRAFMGSVKSGLQGAATSGMARFASVAGIVAAGSFERIAESQFSNFNAFQNYGPGLSRSIANKYYGSSRNTPNLFQSFMLGAERYGGGAVEGGAKGMSLGLRTIATGLGALTSDPLSAIPELLNPQSPLYLNAQGINAPQSKTPWADMFGVWFQNFKDSTYSGAVINAVKDRDSLYAAMNRGNQ